MSFQCVECGVYTDSRYASETKARLSLTQRCYNCDYWAQAAEKAEDSVKRYREGKWPSSLVYMKEGKKHLCFFGAEVPNTDSLGRGLGGARFLIQFSDGAHMVSSNVWSPQIIPELWGPRFQITGNLISLGAFVEGSAVFNKHFALGRYYTPD